SVAVQGDGKIVVGGDGYLSGDKVAVIIRLLGNGSLDATFNIDGMYEQSLHVGWIEEIALGPNGSIVAVGTARPENQTGDFAVLKVAADGAPDANFGDNGMVTVNFSGHQDIARSLLLYANGKILVAGSAGMGMHNDFALTRIIGQSPAIGAPGRFGRPTDVMFVNPSTTPNPRENLLSSSGQLQTAPQPQGEAQVHSAASGSVKSPAPRAASSSRNASVHDSLFALFGEDEHDALIAAHLR
ncbi:MAG: hypothetical protein IT423_21980, partial [Pirellulaceae bacterium]|nr:hypothetical protein [Pirellulaceae bacterium]